MKRWVPVVFLVFLMVGVAYAGTFTSYNDITALADGDQFLVYDASEGSGDYLANITWANLRSEMYADTSAGDYKDDTVNSADINTIVESVMWNAGGMSADGTQCADPAQAVINSGPEVYTIICADNDASQIEGYTTMPDSWDGGTVVFELSLLQTAADTNNFQSDVSVQARGDGEAINNTWGTEVAMDSAMAGSSAIDHITSAAVTPNCTTSCQGGDTLFWRLEVDATGTTTAMATVHIVDMKMEYTSNVGD